MVFATSNLRLSGAARRQLTCREEVPLRDRRLRRLRRVRNLLPNEIAFLQPSHRQFVQRPRTHSRLESESNRRARGRHGPAILLHVLQWLRKPKLLFGPPSRGRKAFFLFWRFGSLLRRLAVPPPAIN